MELDFTSLFAGISLTAIGGWLGSFLALRKDEKAIHIEQITKERTKWRENIRLYTLEAVELFSSSDGAPSKTSIAKIRVKFATSLSPKSSDDKKILEVFDSLTYESDMSVFTEHVALLLKHDWERVKWECMPIYLKPFIFFTAKQKEWRSKSYRVVANKS